MTPQEAYEKVLEMGDAAGDNFKPDANLEAIIAQGAEQSYYYAVWNCERFDLGEAAIATDVEYAIDYAYNFGWRFEAAEDVIATADPEELFVYLTEVPDTCKNEKLVQVILNSELKDDFLEWQRTGEL